jgi:hypothetical protein
MRTLRTFTGLNATADAREHLGGLLGPNATFVAHETYRRTDGRVFGLRFDAFPYVAELDRFEAAEAESAYLEGVADGYAKLAAEHEAPSKWKYRKSLAESYRRLEAEHRLAAAVVRGEQSTPINAVPVRVAS